jgi:hypothetical protein
MGGGIEQAVDPVAGAVMSGAPGATGDVEQCGRLIAPAGGAAADGLVGGGPQRVPRRLGVDSLARGIEQGAEPLFLRVQLSSGQAVGEQVVTGPGDEGREEVAGLHRFAENLVGEVPRGRGLAVPQGRIGPGVGRAGLDGHGVFLLSA